LESSIQQAAQYLWDLDINRLDPGADYKINVQRGKKWGEDGWRQDQGEDPLFVSVDRSAFARPTYKAFIALLNNYTSEVGVKETVSTKERTENWTFLRAIMQTAPMQFCHKYCVENGNDVPQDRDEFMKLLHYIWFKTYTRDRRGEGNDSSGFEHVFVGEIKNGKVSGFHNWINFYFEEKKGNVDYRGYIEKDHQAETNNDDHILTIQFDWNGIRKSIGTSFVGVSPEFEMALYTMCFLVGEENNMLELKTDNDVFTLNCKVYRFGDKISTSFVETKGHKD
jgi:poly(U)-specific endoribonuclease